MKQKHTSPNITCKKNSKPVLKINIHNHLSQTRDKQTANTNATQNSWCFIHGESKRVQNTSNYVRQLSKLLQGDVAWWWGWWFWRARQRCSTINCVTTHRLTSHRAQHFHPPTTNVRPVDCRHEGKKSEYTHSAKVYTRKHRKKDNLLSISIVTKLVKHTLPLVWYSHYFMFLFKWPLCQQVTGLGDIFKQWPLVSRVNSRLESSLFEYVA